MESSSVTNSDKQNQSSSGDTERWASLIGGGALVLFGLSQRSLRGALLAVAGGGLAARGPGGVGGVGAGAGRGVLWWGAVFVEVCLAGGGGRRFSGPRAGGCGGFAVGGRSESKH